MDEPTALRRSAAAGALIAGVAVALGAFGTHSLRGRLSPEALGQWGTGVQYGSLAGVGIIALSAAGASLQVKTSRAGGAIAAGAVVFQLSLYALALGGPRAFGAVAPIGGVLMIGGWFAAAYAFARR